MRDIGRWIALVFVIGLVVGAFLWGVIRPANSRSTSNQKRSASAPTVTVTKTVLPAVVTKPTAIPCPAGKYMVRLASILNGPHAELSAEDRLAEINRRKEHFDAKVDRTGYTAVDRARVCQAVVDDVNADLYAYVVWAGAFPSKMDADRFCRSMGYAPKLSHNYDCLPKYVGP